MAFIYFFKSFQISVFSLPQLRAESIKGFLSGAIAMATPDTPGGQVKDGSIFELEEKQKGEWLKWAPKIEIPIGKGDAVRKEKAPPKESMTIRGSLNFSR